MPLRTYLRFFLSAEDQARVDPASVQVEDIPYAAAPAANAPYPQSMRVTFRVTNPEAGPPMIRPLFPGQVTFTADAAAPGRLPLPAEVELTEAAYATWRTLGRLKVTVVDRDVTNDLDRDRTQPEVRPNTVWFSPIRISRPFLFDTLVTGLPRVAIGGTTPVATTAQAWPRHAVSRFLGGQYAPILRLGATQAEDDIARLSMPTVEMAADGTVVLVISMARQQSVGQDGGAAAFNASAAGIPEQDPAHPSYGAIPARLVYRTFRTDLIGAGTDSAFANSVLAEWPQAPRYFALRFTRTWQPVPNCSVFFPRQVVRVSDQAGTTVLAEQRLPSHGIFYLSQAPATPPPEPPGIQVSVTGGMRWLSGTQTQPAWRVVADTVPLTLSLADPTPHIILRRRMSEEMLADTLRPSPGGWLCTYLSMRRSLRALIDHRISGGRLCFGTTTSPETRALINRAWGSTDAQNAASLVANNRPPTDNITPEDGGGRLRNIYQRLFPDAATPQGGCVPAPTANFTQGRVGYDLWQTIVGSFSANSSRCYFGDAFIGRGGPGSAAAMGLATIVDNPAATDDATTTAVQTRLTNSLLAGGLEPGAVLQYWGSGQGFEEIRNRQELQSGGGHSPVFLRYVRTGTTITGIRVIDQSGEHDYSVFGGLLGGNEVWIAANWME